MFRELDQRHSHGLTVTLEWDPATGNVQVLCENRHSPEASFAHLVDPKDARHAFLHPFALRPSRGDSDQSVSTPDHGQVAGRKRRSRWFRRSTEAEPDREAPHETCAWWMWWMWRLP
jgi:hypothetical protein